MKTFKDLYFKPHSLGTGYHAKMTFDGGDSISVVYGYHGFYADNGTYEMMSTRTNTADGIRGYLTEEQITRHMIYIQRNPRD